MSKSFLRQLGTPCQLLKATTRTYQVGSILCVLGLGVHLSGCHKQSVKPTPEVEEQVADSSVREAENADQNPLGTDSDSGSAFGLRTVHFPYDSFEFDRTAQGLLDQNAELMKEKPELKIQIEGHCDERGSTQYNIALGEKRANAVRRYLVAHGIKPDRITVISFGKEKPIDMGTTEAAYAKNRRANFVVTTY